MNNTMVLTTIMLFNLALFSHMVDSRKVFNESNYSVNNETKLDEIKWKSECDHAQIQISQGEESAVGIPRYTVMITNLCSDCLIAKVHLHCGWFASADVVNPEDFKRLSYDDCLVYGGRPIPSGHVIEFHYSNTFSYPLSVASYVCSY
ncbi:hypothetical protein ABFS83_11G027300 [Erythranthe nasuta]